MFAKQQEPLTSARTLLCRGLARRRRCEFLVRTSPKEVRRGSDLSRAHYRPPVYGLQPTASRRFEDGGSVATFKRHVTCPYPAPTGDLFSPLGLQDSLPDNQSPHIRTDRQSGSPKLQVLQLAPPPKLSLSAPPRAQGIQHRTPADTYPGGVRTTGKSPPLADCISTGMSLCAAEVTSSGFFQVAQATNSPRDMFLPLSFTIPLLATAGMIIRPLTLDWMLWLASRSTSLVPARGEWVQIRLQTFIRVEAPAIAMPPQQGSPGLQTPQAAMIRWNYMLDLGVTRCTGVTAEYPQQSGPYIQGDDSSGCRDMVRMTGRRLERQLRSVRGSTGRSVELLRRAMQGPSTPKIATGHRAKAVVLSALNLVPEDIPWAGAAPAQSHGQEAHWQTAGVEAWRLGHHGGGPPRNNGGKRQLAGPAPTSCSSHGRGISIQDETFGLDTRSYSWPIHRLYHPSSLPGRARGSGSTRSGQISVDPETHGLVCRAWTPNTRAAMVIGSTTAQHDQK
ncbi:hypothetical protein ACCO45_006925 [Purpureocillium lilacinum]|uniref:Uncharacterized protein n=1 Tax=Purpureocillium lilacinum TaxID=33203 RepID=A0ACC4DTZ9_PURLI